MEESVEREGSMNEIKEQEPRQTKWMVIEGGPSSGKTTIVNKLKNQNYEILEEAARRLLNYGYKRQDEIQFTLDVFNSQRDAEERLDTDNIVFLDRGLPGRIAYLLMEGRDWSDPQIQMMLEESRRRVYSEVYILEPLPFFETQTQRTENIEFARKAFKTHVDVYEKLGYKPVIVPVLPPDERADFVIKDATQKGKL